MICNNNMCFADSGLFGLSSGRGKGRQSTLGSIRIKITGGGLSEVLDCPCLLLSSLQLLLALHFDFLSDLMESCHNVLSIF